MIKLTDRIGYIHRLDFFDGHTRFRYVEAKIKALRPRKDGGVSIDTDRFRALDMEDVEQNTEIMKKNSKLILVNEPFVTDDEFAKRFREVVDYWNKNGAETAFGNKTTPKKEG